MTDVDRQLVQRITERVIRALSNEPRPSGSGRPDAAEPSAASSTSSDAITPGLGASDAPAHVRPAIGVCTGDYRRFTDRPDLVAEASQSRNSEGRHNEQPPSGSRCSGGSEPSSASAALVGPPPHDREALTEASPADPLPRVGPVLSGFVTAAQVDAAPGDRLLLEAGAKLTPLAEDRVRERGMSVRRASRLAGRRDGSGEARRGGSGAGPGAWSGEGEWLWWSDERCPEVKGAVDGLDGWRLTPVSASSRGPEAIAAVVRAVAERVGSRRAAGAVLFVRGGAAATCLANRSRALRAILGPCPASVERGVRDMAANVLIVEHGFHDRHRMASIVRRFLETPRPAPPVIERRLREVEPCA